MRLAAGHHLQGRDENRHGVAGEGCSWKENHHERKLQPQRLEREGLSREECERVVEGVEGEMVEFYIMNGKGDYGLIK